MKQVAFWIVSLLVGISIQAEELPFVTLENESGKTIEAQILGKGIPGKGFPIRLRDGREMHVALESLSDDSITTIANEMARQASGAPATAKSVFVSCETVKSIDGKFRYFFQIKNFGRPDFDGEIRITLQNAMAGITNGGPTTFETQAPMPQGGGTVVFIEKSTGPRSVHQDASIIGFSYQAVTKAGVTVADGSGKIPESVTR